VIRSCGLTGRTVWPTEAMTVAGEQDHDAMHVYHAVSQTGEEKAAGTHDLEIAQHRDASSGSWNSTWREIALNGADASLLVYGRNSTSIPSGSRRGRPRNGG